MHQQQLQFTSSEMFSGEAFWTWGDEQWGWLDGSLWPFPEGFEGVDFCLFNESPSISQAQAIILPSGICQQTLRTTEPEIDPHFEAYNIPPANPLTYEQQAHLFPSGSPTYQLQAHFPSGSTTYSQPPSLGFSPMPSQDSPASVEQTPPSMPLPYILLNHGEASMSGSQLQDAQPPAVLTDAVPGLPVELMDGRLPKDRQAHPESFHGQAQNQGQPASTDQLGHSPKLPARRQRRKDKPEACPICGKGHAYQAELDRHIIAQHKDQAEKHALSTARLPCPHCPRDFARKDHLVRHRQRKHGLAKQQKRSKKI
ncbi:hypothetical protein SMACR_12733 [Sordaria macrospora]|uniref:WGS project CABT00000000 data, contig 2.2 n=2 Tax=Sordaria macrospora TaxID=5147 RepID=F7VNS4_SORMK|nr:uncharacterized protein SMAC_12733 [Sordaria macrospora k-hell]KAA8632785.1 hypothetical protein SMACR_12733 [Sordaria macrospora]WPJ62268.1 hypothetical protein SMAC4_12733 [Sordaria macrospora]CCC07003.1 unnamed protein product [Sordaria macrospora k-hell]